MCRVGIIRASMNRECAASDHQHRQQRLLAVLERDLPRREPQIALRRIPGAMLDRSAGRPGWYSGPHAGRVRRNHVIDPVHPTRSAITVAGISGVAASSARTRGSNGVNAVGTAGPLVLRRAVAANARATVSRAIPRSRAICRCGNTLAAVSRRINAQSSTVITHPICLGGLVFDRRYGLVFKRRRQAPGRSLISDLPGVALTVLLLAANAFVMTSG